MITSWTRRPPRRWSELLPGCRAVCLIVAVAAVLRLSPMGMHRFHVDEALYAYFARLISSGRDIFLRSVVLDKGPVFLYTLAGFFRALGPSETVARLPNLLASLVSIIMLYQIADELYDRRTALLSACLLALSPFDIQFAATAFTDPMMVCFALVSASLALRANFFWSGVTFGLAIMTKLTAAFMAPLVIALALHAARRVHTKSPWQSLAFGVLGFSIVLCMGVLWDVVLRVQAINIISAGRLLYGDVGTVQLNEVLPRLRSWLDQMQYFTGSPPLNALLMAALPGLVCIGWLSRRVRSGWLWDCALIGFLLYFVAVHTLLTLRIYDRYLLGLAPIVSLILARVLLMPPEIATKLHPARPVAVRSYLLVVSVALAVLVLNPVRIAARYGYPVGADHGAYLGIESVVGYLEAHAPENSIVFDKWLGWHYGFYLFDSEIEIVSHHDADDVATTLLEEPNKKMYIVIPTWEDGEALGQQLALVGCRLDEEYRAYRPDGTPSFIVNRVELVRSPNPE